MAALQPVRGTHDLLADAYRRQQFIIETGARVAALYGFQTMATPVFEFTDVFRRTLGETSDVVSKEMYSFEDRGGESLTLRPEGTAGICRAVISNGLQHALPLKAYYHGPMFRYERPQKGRQRMFHQIGVELIGPEQVSADLEVLSLAHQLLGELGLADDITLELNTLGDTESRLAYRDALVAYFKGHIDKLSEDSRARLGRNPLRILDSKDEGDRDVVARAPGFDAFLNDHSTAFFTQLCEGLEVLGIPHTLNPRLVRGLDYYCHTCFEFTTRRLGAQGTVLAGGRYDGLVEMMGGPRIPGIGFAAGVERLALLAGDKAGHPERPVVLVPMGAAAQARGITLVRQLRDAGISVDMSYSGNMKKRLKRADKANARLALILGDNELEAGRIQLRDLDCGAQRDVALDVLVAEVKAMIGSE